MRILVFILLFNCAMAAETNVAVAIKTTQQAILATPTVKTYVKNLEKIIISRLPIEKNTASTLAAIGVTLSRGQINTDPIKGMKIKFLGGKIRPDLNYDLKTKDWTTIIRFNKDFQ